jgi:hypothetical protein
MTQDSAADRKSIRAQEKKAAQIDRARGDFVRVMMSTPDGRLYTYEQLATCNIFHTTFNLNAYQMAFAEGQRDIGLHLLADIMRFCPEQYLPMVREANVRHDSNNRRTSSSTPAGSTSGEYPGSETTGRDLEGSTGIDYDPYSSDDTRSEDT